MMYCTHVSGAVCTMIWSMVGICRAPSSTAEPSPEDIVWSAAETQHSISVTQSKTRLNKHREVT